MDIGTLCQLIDAKKETLFDILSKLVKINSENFGSYGNEKECAEFIYKLCKELGMEAEMYSPMELENFAEHPDYFPGRHLENRYNVTACWRGEEDQNRLMLMGHLDTVPIGDPDQWVKDPLSGEICDGKVYGRGACDDKYAIAVCLFLVDLLKKAGVTLKKNLVITAYCDEEVGGSHGALAAALRYPCQTILNMDGRVNQIWHCASGGQVVTYRYKVRGNVDNAKKAARALPLVMDVLDAFGDRRREEFEKNPYYAGTVVPATSFRYGEVRAGYHDLDREMGVIRFTFYTDKTKEIIWDEFAQMEAQLQETLSPLGIDGLGFTADTRFFHYGHCDPQSENIRILLDAAKCATGLEPLVCGSCLSDLSVLLKYGHGEAFAFGNGAHFDQAGGPHQPNECIDCDSLVKYCKNIAAYILHILT